MRAAGRRLRAGRRSESLAQRFAGWPRARPWDEMRRATQRRSWPRWPRVIFDWTKSLWLVLSHNPLHSGQHQPLGGRGGVLRSVGCRARRRRPPSAEAASPKLKAEGAPGATSPWTTILPHGFTSEWGCPRAVVSPDDRVPVRPALHRHGHSADPHVLPPCLPRRRAGE